eukprot:72329_1
MKCRRFALLFSLVFMVVLDTGHATNKNYDFQKSDNSLTQNEVYDADINMDSQTQGTVSANSSDDDDDIDIKPSSTDNTLSEPPCKKRRLNDEQSSGGEFITTDDDALTDVSIHNVFGPKCFGDGGDLELDRTPFAEPGSLSVSLGTHLKYLHHPYYDDLTSFLRGCSRFSGKAEILYIHELKTSPSAEFSWVEAEISKHPSTILSVKSKNFMFPWKLTHKPRGPQNIKLPMTLTKLIITAEYDPCNGPSDSVITKLNSMQCGWNMNPKFTLNIVYGLNRDEYNSSDEPLKMITIQHVGQTVIFEFGVSFVHSLYRREQADYF